VSEDVGLGPNGSTLPLPPPPPPPTAAEKTKPKKKDENKKGNKEKQSAAAQREKAAKKRGHRSPTKSGGVRKSPRRVSAESNFDDEDADSASIISHV